MVKKKYKSKRISLKDKYKVQRRVIETHRKNRKQAKKDAKNGIIRDKRKKDPGIPNSWPFKQELLNDIAKARDVADRRKQEQKEAVAAQRKNNSTASNLEELMANANSSRAQFDAKLPAGDSDTTDMRTPKNAVGQQSRRAYLQTLRKVIDTSDIILQVLDARDPMGTRIHPSIENTILQHYDKRMVLVLNKIDLLPKDAVSGWLNYLRKSQPTIAIKCGTNRRENTVGRADVDCQGALSSSCGVGVDGLMGLLKNYCRTSGGGGKTCVTVGVIGYPNVGKSSIINTLKRSRAVGVSPRPGFTTSMQEVVLDKNLRLVDSPGVVFDDTEQVGGAETLLRNCVDVDSIQDPIPAVEALLKRCSTESLMMTYSIPEFPRGDAMIFLAMIAKRNGRVLKGGIPDKNLAARNVLRDWNSGKIPFFTRPPEVDVNDSDRGSICSDAKIVSAFGEAFDVRALDESALSGLKDTDEMDYVQMENVESRYDDVATKNANAAVSFLTGKGGDDDESMEEDEEEAMSDDEDVETNTRERNAIADAEDYDFDNM